MNELGGKLLREVSRSFYLTLRLLPRAMREPASVGYLLARASDTIADSEGVPVEVRRRELERFREAAVGAGRGRFEVPGDLVAGVDKRAERILLERVDEVLTWRDSLKTGREALERVLRDILEGQMEDLEQPRHLETAEELMRYADLVAGSVGRFWCEIAREADPHFSNGRYRFGEMKHLAERYGCGLQLLNILRDLHEDLPKDRRYLPGGDVSDEAIVHWLERSRAEIRCGLEFADGLRSRRLRLASVLPARIGLATLRELRKEPGKLRTGRVKIQRGEVRRILAGTAWKSLVGRVR